ncbi:retrotransposon protein, putative, ty1-copia subclass [Tanacetum coccineum]
MGYYFYFPPENKIVVASNIPQEVEGFEPPKPPQEEVIPIRRSERTHRAPTRLCLNVEVEEHSLGDLGEPTNYKAAMLDPESKKWVDAMNAKMQSMIDNMGYTQAYLVDYEETFSPVADIRGIRILISIAAFYDYEIWQMDVKTTFLNGYLDEDIYMVRPEIRKICLCSVFSTGVVIGGGVLNFAFSKAIISLGVFVRRVNLFGLFSCLCWLRKPPPFLKFYL